MAETKMESICENLKYKFLYNNDIDSIHILLNLYDVQNKMINISPYYISTETISNKIKKILTYRTDKDIISEKIVSIIREDISRLELIFNIEGYLNGFNDYKTVNKLEEILIQIFPIERIYENSCIFYTDIEEEKVKELKSSLSNSVYELESKNRDIYNFVEKYCNEFIKYKIFKFNENLDRQLKIEYKDDTIKLIEEKLFLSVEELNILYESILKDLYKNIKKIYANSSWFGVNDKLINRY